MNQPGTLRNSVGPNFAAGMIFVFLVGVVFFAPLALLPLYLQNLRGLSAFLSQTRPAGIDITR